jgi:hypothetical protein
MNTPDEVLKLQRQLSENSGQKKVSEWLFVVALVVLVGSATSAIIGKESLLRAVASPLFSAVLCLYMRKTAKRRTHDLEKQLSS